MKTKKIEMTVYENGDVIDISDIVFRFQNGKENTLPHSQKAKARIDSTNRMLIMSVIELKEGGMLYKGFMSNGKSITLKQNELGKEKYIGHVDLHLMESEK